jgi:hypothetical protein
VAPSDWLLATGADVLWLDIRPPSAAVVDMPNRGALAWAKDGADLLQAPGRIAQTVVDFAAGAPVHLCLFAYAPGASRELRLAAAMNAIVDRLPGSLVQSVSLLVSPTTPLEMTVEDIAAAVRRRQNRPVWQAAFDGLGRLGKGPLHLDRVGVARSIVPLQGAAYQAAQVLAKRVAAETWFGRGVGQGERRSGQVISANVAPITSTRSLGHPLFQAGFLGAPKFGVHISAPATTRLVSCLLMLHDWLNPASPARRPAFKPVDHAALAALGSQQIHGGIAGLPYTLDPAIAVAALIGLAKKPSLLTGFFGSR